MGKNHATKSKPGSLCLTMIVRNESKVILRCLESVKDYIDYWVICDTGSDDNTKEIITTFFTEHKIPGELLEHEWKNFGHNRSLAVQATKNKAEYSLLMDADFVFIVKDPKFKKTLGKDKADGYHIGYEGGLDYRQMLCVKSSLDWEYTGVTHEYLHSKQLKKRVSYDGFTFLHHADGGCRSDKFERDIRLLLEALETEPTNERYMFYLAQSYKDVQEWANAIEWYEKRAKLGGFGEEVYHCFFQIGVCKKQRGDDFWEYYPHLLQAYFYRPHRLESMYHLIQFCRESEHYLLGYRIGKLILNNAYPKDDILFIDRQIHNWKCIHEVAMCAYWAKKYQKGLEILERILQEEKFSPSSQTYLMGHLKLFRAKVNETVVNETVLVDG